MKKISAITILSVLIMSLNFTSCQKDKAECNKDVCCSVGQDCKDEDMDKYVWGDKENEDCKKDFDKKDYCDKKECTDKECDKKHWDKDKDFDKECDKDCDKKEKFIYKKVIKKEVKKSDDCDYYVSGIVEFYKDKDWVATIDFGDGTCDEWATKKTKDGENKFSMKK